MPMLTLHICSPEAQALIPKAVEVVVALTSRLLRKDRLVTVVAVQPVPPASWYLAGRPLAEAGGAAFFLEARVTNGTNTKDEKAAYIAQVHSAMAALLGDLHLESYVHVVEASADAYGYGGVTQERRSTKARIDGVY